MIAYVILFASFRRVVFACIRWILVYFYCFVHTVKLKAPRAKLVPPHFLYAGYGPDDAITAFITIVRYQRNSSVSVLR